MKFNELKQIRIYVILFLFWGLTGCVSKETKVIENTSSPAKNYRYVICTDMTHDDDNSLIRLLHYSNEIDIEAIILADQGPEAQRTENWLEKMWKRTHSIIDAYGQVVDNLRLHDQNFPSAEYFHSITKRGKGYAQRMTGTTDNGHEKFWDYVGEGWDTEGSDFLQEVFDRNDDRPIYVGFWGGSITFAQAMWRYQQKNSPEQVQQLLNKLIFHCISFQDVTFDMFLNLDSIGNNVFNKYHFYGDYDQERLIPGMLLADVVNFWNYLKVIDVNKVHSYSGTLGQLYDKGGEGDTPAFLNLIAMNLGLSNIANPDFGGWGDMFQPYGLKNVWMANPSKSNELKRWSTEASNSFYARCMWETKDYESANHDPVAAFDGDLSKDFVFIDAQPGETVQLNSNGSFDPDGDELVYRWWHYDVADSFNGNIEISNAHSKESSFKIPVNSGGEAIHVVLEVKDNGFPTLCSYKRIIINVKSDLIEVKEE